MSNTNSTITQARLKELFSYDPDTGIFTKKTGFYAGEVCNSIAKVGYIRIGIDWHREYAHRLAFLYMTGAMPKKCVDHINQNKTDNRWCNLREVSRKMNNQNISNARSHNQTGILGVFKEGNKFATRIVVNGKKIYLGSYETQALAKQVYDHAKRRLHEGSTI
jgi:hypothetical protein